MSVSVFIYVYENENDPTLEKLNDSKNGEFVSKVFATKQVRKRLLIGSKGVIIEEIPCFIISEKNSSDVGVYSSNETEIVLQIISNYIQKGYL